MPIPMYFFHYHYYVQITNKTFICKLYLVEKMYTAQCTTSEQSHSNLRCRWWHFIENLDRLWICCFWKWEVWDNKTNTYIHCLHCGEYSKNSTSLKSDILLRSYFEVCRLGWFGPIYLIAVYLGFSITSKPR